jgi:hypothetical protein
MGTDSIVAFDFLGGVLYINTLSFEVIDPFLEVLFGTGQFHDHESLFARQDSGIEDIENQIEVTGQIAYDRFFNFGPGKSQY